MARKRPPICGLLAAHPLADNHENCCMPQNNQRKVLTAGRVACYFSPAMNAKPFALKDFGYLLDVYGIDATLTTRTTLALVSAQASVTVTEGEIGFSLDDSPPVAAYEASLALARLFGLDEGEIRGDFRVLFGNEDETHDVISPYYGNLTLRRKAMANP